MKNIIISALLITVLSACSFSKKEFNAESAWQEFSQTFNQDYAYRDTAGFDAAKLMVQYKEKALLAQDEAEFIDVIQVFLRYFRDPHLSFGPMNANDYSVTPTGSDIWAIYQDGRYVIEDLKGGGAAYNSGLQVNDEIISVDGLAVDDAINQVFGGDFSNLSNKQKIWGLNIALGGLRNATRTITVMQSGTSKTYNLAATYDAIRAGYDAPPLSFKNIGQVGYIRFNNSLGNSDTVAAFEDAIKNLIDTDTLIIDLRDIPSGGNTGVAEPILGHFVKKRTAYQLYQIQEDGLMFHQAEMQQAFARPTAPFYSKPYVVLVGRWTGSIGEGMTIGFDSLGAKAIIGAPAADLLGGIKNIELDESGGTFSVGYERMFHVNGTFREDFEVDQPTTPADWGIDGTDPALSKALDILSQDNKAAL